jgi:hypothetical protein
MATLRPASEWHYVAFHERDVAVLHPHGGRSAEHDQKLLCSMVKVVDEL